NSDLEEGRSPLRKGSASTLITRVHVSVFGAYPQPPLVSIVLDNGLKKTMLRMRHQIGRSA
ncbi:MAG: hypothetical protein ACP5K1_02630, partial [Candidatus Bathyarchaeia archaeon]